MRPDHSHHRHHDRDHRHRDRNRSPDRHRDQKRSHGRGDDRKDHKDRRIREYGDRRREDRHHDDRRPGRRQSPDREHISSSRSRNPVVHDSHHRHTERNDSAPSSSSSSNRRENETPAAGAEKPAEPKQKPDFAQSGKLAEDTNTFNGVVVKYNEPPDAKAPKRKWRLYPFKAGETLDFIPIHSQSAYLMGRDRRVADIPIDHPSCSMQHAAIQFRSVPFEREDGSTGKRVRPYVIDLESSNGTFLNNEKIEAKRFHQLFEKDVLKFGFSSRDYVVLTEEFRDEDEVDNQMLPLLPE